MSDDVFEAASRVSRDNSKWSPRNVGVDEAWLLRALVGVCGVGVSCHKMRGRDGTMHRYYYCRNHDPLRAGAEHLRCRERNIRSDALDAFVFEQVLLAGENAVSSSRASWLARSNAAPKNSTVAAERSKTSAMPSRSSGTPSPRTTGSGVASALSPKRSSPPSTA